MVKAIEKAGFPITHLANLLPVTKTVGANRIVQTISIPYPFANPEDSENERFEMKKKLVKIGLDALSKEIEEQTVFTG